MRWVRLVGAVVLTGLGICSLESTDRGDRPAAVGHGQLGLGALMPGGGETVIHFPTGRLRMTMTDRNE